MKTKNNIQRIVDTLLVPGTAITVNKWLVQVRQHERLWYTAYFAVPPASAGNMTREVFSDPLAALYEILRMMEEDASQTPQEAPSASLPPGHTDEAACMPSQSTISPPGDSPTSADP